jgi:hypothetical protein
MRVLLNARIRQGAPDTCPILNDDAGNLLLTRTLMETVFVESTPPKVACDLPFLKHICSCHSQDLLRPLPRRTIDCRRYDYRFDGVGWDCG